MFTVCPKCALTLVVTAEDLRVAQGYVRCGRCSSVFNALARLTEERSAAETGRGESPRLPRPSSRAAGGFFARTAQRLRPARGRSAAAPASTDEDAIPEDALEFDPSKTDVSSVFVEPPPNPQWTAATGTFKAMIAANQEAAPTQDSDSQIDVEIDPELLASILHIDLAEPPAPPQASTRRLRAAAPAPRIQPRPRRRGVARPARGHRWRPMPPRVKHRTAPRGKHHRPPCGKYRRRLRARQPRPQGPRPKLR